MGLGAGLQLLYRSGTGGDFDGRNLIYAKGCDGDQLELKGCDGDQLELKGCDGDQLELKGCDGDQLPGTRVKRMRRRPTTRN